MKNLNRSIMVLIMGATSISAINAVDNVSNRGAITTTIVQVQTVPDNDPYHREENNRGNRAPSHPLSCTIDPDSGISFIGQETPDFILYEIYDSGNMCVGAYGDERAFIDALFSLTGEYRISLSTEEVSYTGYIVL